MNITNKDYETIKAIRDLLPKDEEFDSLSAIDQKKIIDFDVTLVNLYRKKKKDNERISSYIAEKRKINKNYARKPYIKKGDR